MKKTISYDVNSKKVHREINYIPCESINILKADILETLNKSIEVTPDMLKTNLLQRFIRAVVRVFAPML